jgi:hypothetical protein
MGVFSGAVDRETVARIFSSMPEQRYLLLPTQYQMIDSQSDIAVLRKPYSLS